MATVPFLAAKGIGKRFGALVALSDVDLDVCEGQVLALVGDNGAGKSTFIKILAGAHLPSAGEIRVEWRAGGVCYAARRRLRRHRHDLPGAGAVRNLSIADNVYLGREIVRRIAGIPFLRRAEMKRRVSRLLVELDAHIADVDAVVGSLSGGQRQAVAICRALNLSARLVIMDEPTAALAVAETRKVLGLARRLAERGCAVLLISHNIADVMDIADRIVVFRRGRKIAERNRDVTNAEEIIALITGAHPDVRALEKAS